MRYLIPLIFVIGCSPKVSLTGTPYSYCFEGRQYVQHRLVTTAVIDDNGRAVKCVPSPTPSP